MPIPSTPSIMPNVLGYAADTVQIPETTPTGQGIPSFRDLFPFITQVNPDAGGVMVERAWMNALFNLLGQHAFFQQSGCVYPWQATLNYIAGSHVKGSDDVEYIALQHSGPDVSGTGAKDPTLEANRNYWISLSSFVSGDFVPDSRRVIAGTGLTGGGPLSSDVTLSAKLDGKTTQAAADGAITVKDVAIGGDLGDLASARGQVGDARQLADLDFNMLTVPGFYRTTGNPKNGPIGISGASIGSLFVSGMQGNGNRLFQIMVSGNGIYWRTSISGGTTWEIWNQVLTGNKIGDGIRNTNGIISVPEMQGATASTSGTSGLVPPAAAGQHESFLTGGGEYKPALTKISDSVNLADSKTAASAKAVKTTYDLANGKQANLGFTPVQQGGGTGQEGNKIYIGWGSGGLRAQADALNLGNIVTTEAGQTKAPQAALADALVVTPDGQMAKFNWAGRTTGQPDWVWGGNASEFGNMYTWNPANFGVNYATNASNAWQTTIVPNVVAGDNMPLPAGGTWVYFSYANEQVNYGAVAGGTYISGRHIAIRNA